MSSWPFQAQPRTLQTQLLGCLCWLGQVRADFQLMCWQTCHNTCRADARRLSKVTGSFSAVYFAVTLCCLSLCLWSLTSHVGYIWKGLEHLPGTRLCSSVADAHLFPDCPCALTISGCKCKPPGLANSSHVVRWKIASLLPPAQAKPQRQTDYGSCSIWGTLRFTMEWDASKDPAKLCMSACMLLDLSKR